MGCYPHFSLAMGWPRGFASTAPDSNRPFGLAFASAAGQSPLTWPVTVSRRIIMQKARHQALPPERGHSPLTACRRVVSGSVSSPRRGSSHRSLALLFAIGRQGVLSLAGWAPQIQARFHVSGPTQVPDQALSPAAYGAITRYGGPFQVASARVLEP